MPHTTTPAAEPARRTRQPKLALTRAGIVAAAIGILESDGTARLTMRRVADVLDTGPASLYVYIANQRELYALVVEELFGRVLSEPHAAPVAPDAVGTWRERLYALLLDLSRVLERNLGSAPLLLTLRPDGPNFVRLFDHVLGLLSEGGVAPREAALAADNLLLFVVATVAEHDRQAHPNEQAELTSQLAAIARADSHEYPHISRLRPQLMDNTTDRLRWGYDRFIAGLLVAAAE